MTFFAETMSADEAVKLMQIVQAGYMTVDNLLFLYDRGRVVASEYRPNS
jgi:hypothetical protein